MFIEELEGPGAGAAVSPRDRRDLRNSLAETLTETEKAFQLGFVAMTEAILLAIQAVSYVVIVIIMAVMANTMAMTARERYGEYATLKALGFGGGFVARLIFAESLGIALAGGALGIALTFPAVEAFSNQMGTCSRSSTCRRNGRVAGRVRPRGRRGRCRRAGVARGAHAHRRRPAGHRLGGTGDTMAIPLSYIARNLFARRLTTALTAGGMALVVFVFATVLMLAAGLEKTLVATGQDDNVLVIRRGAQTEVQSGVDRQQAAVIESLPEIAVDADGGGWSRRKRSC